MRNVIGEEFEKQPLLRNKPTGTDPFFVELKNSFIPGTTAVYHRKERLNKKQYRELPPRSIEIYSTPTAGEIIIIDYQTNE